MLRENLQILFSLSILFISTNSLHLNNRGSGGINIDSIGIGNNIVGSSTSDNNIDDITDDSHSYRRSQISSTSNLGFIDPRLNNRILIGEQYKKLPISLGGGGGGNSGPSGGNIGEPKYKLFDDNFMKFNHIKTTNSSPSRHYSFGYIRNLENVIPDIDDDIDIINDNDYINNYHHHPILIGLNQQQHYHPKDNHQYGNIPIFTGDSSELLLRNNEFPPLTHFNRKPSLQLSSTSSILHNIPPLPKYAMINGNRNRYEHDNYGYKFDDQIPKKYSNIKNNDDLINIDNDRNNNNNNNKNDYDDNDGMINDEPYDYRKRRNYKKNNKINNNQTPPKALQELFQQNGDINSNSRSNNDNGKNGNNINSREIPLDIRIQSKQQTTKLKQDQQQQQQQQQQKQQQRQTKKQLKQNENKQKKLLQMEKLKQIKRSGSSGGPPPQMMPPNSHSIASQLMLRTARGQRQYDVPQIECPSAMDGMERFACPTPDRQGRYRCIDDHVLCDGFIDCPEGEDEDRSSCMFYKTTKAHLDVLADALLRWARGR